MRDKQKGGYSGGIADVTNDIVEEGALADEARVPAVMRLIAAPWLNPTTRSRQWTVRYTLTAYVAWWVLAGAISLVLWLAGVHIRDGPGVLIVEAVFLATLVPLYRSGSLRAVDLGLRRVPGARSVGLVLLGLIAYGWSSWLWSSAVHPPAVRRTFAGIAHHGTIVIVLTGFAAAVAAPVVEEIFFRGLLYRSLRNRLGIASASIIAGVMFGAIHTQYPLLVRPELAFFGVVAALLYERTGSLLPGIAMHSFIDASSFEFALTGNDLVVATLFGLLAVVLLVRPPLRALGRLLTGKPVFRSSGVRDGVPVK